MFIERRAIGELPNDALGAERLTFRRNALPLFDEPPTGVVVTALVIVKEPFKQMRLRSLILSTFAVQGKRKASAAR